MVNELQDIASIDFQFLLSKGLLLGFITVLSVGLFSLGLFYALKLFKS